MGPESAAAGGAGMMMMGECKAPGPAGHSVSGRARVLAGHPLPCIAEPGKVLSILRLEWLRRRATGTHRPQTKTEPSAPSAAECMSPHATRLRCTASSAPPTRAGCEHNGLSRSAAEDAVGSFGPDGPPSATGAGRP